MATRQSVFEGLQHVRKLTRNGIEYQYKREINPPPLRPIAVKLFGRWTVVRALREMADYHRAALEYDALVRRCREVVDSEIVLSYRGPIADSYLSQALTSGGFLGYGAKYDRGDKIPTLRLDSGRVQQNPGTTPYSTEQAIAAWKANRERITKGHAERNKRTKMEHYYAWAKREGRTTAPFVDAPRGYHSKGGMVDGRIADLANDDLTRITSDDLQNYKEFLLNRHSNNYTIDHLSDLKVLLTRTFDDRRFGEGGRDPGAPIKLPSKRTKGSHKQFCDDDVQTIFDALPGQPCHLVWPVKIMAYLGLICEEISDADTRDVERVGDLVVLHVRADHRVMAGGQRNELKTIQRARSLPLHPDIAEEFWAYAERVRAEHGAGPLFPQVHPDRDGLRTAKIGRKVRDFIKGLGIEATPYSFRNRFTTALDNLADPKPTADRERYICGHKIADIHAGYKEHPPHQTYPFIARINPVQK